MHICTKSSIALHCLIFISEYENKTKITSEILAKSTGCNAVIIRNILSLLQKAKIISIVRGVGGAHLERNPNEITMWDIYCAIEPNCLNNLIGIHPNPSNICPVGININKILYKPYHQIEKAIENEMKAITLAQLLDDYHTLENYDSI